MRRDRHDQGGQGCRSLYYFNPHSHEGSDENLSTKRSVASTFQSTLPRRERRDHACEWALQNKFQSTLPRRERHICIKTLFGRTTISIHTPTKGATGGRPPKYKSVKISIHTPTKGATINLKDVRCIKIDFNPHSHEGSDIIFQYIPHIVDISIHTPTKGAT